MTTTFTQIKSKLTSDDLLFVYYSGHGVMDISTKVVVNDSDPMHRYWDLENNLQFLSKQSYVIAVFDCCRTKIDTS